MVTPADTDTLALAPPALAPAAPAAAASVGLSSTPATPESPAPAPAIRPLIPSPVPLFRIDPGWIFLLVGLVTIAVTVLIPAQYDLDVAKWQRDRAVAIEHHRVTRLENYGKYLSAVNHGDDAVLMSLTAVQLNKSPQRLVPLNPQADPAMNSASVFADLEPAPLALPGKPVITDQSSILSRWTMDDRIRVWMLAAGIFCVFLGILPPARAKTPQPVT